MTVKSRPPGNAGAHWAKVAGRRIRLADGARIVRQEHRGVLWYMVHDRVGDRFYRFSPAVYVLLNLLDGRRTVEEAYQLVLDRLGEDAPTELDVIRLFWRLHAADLLRIDGVANTKDAVLRAKALDRQRILAQLRSPLAIRVPLMDPSRLLDALQLVARFVYSVPGFLVWLGCVLYALGLVAVNWDALSSNFSDRILSFDNLVLMWFVFPVVKLFHEFGHGLALKRWGCDSNEMGIMFLVFMPVPYVDASSSAVMRLPRQRAIVGAGGLYVELFIAALATVVWAEAEPGLVRAICFNVMTVAGVSAVFFNGNPLLRYDAYYVLSDMLEIPNLGQRSSQYWLSLIQKRLLGIRNIDYPVEASGERPWLLLYAPLSTAYRLVLMFAIAIFVAKKFFFLGTALAVVAFVNVVVWPLLSGLRFLATSAKLRKGRSRAIIRTSVALGTLGVLLFVVPVPSRTVAEGVVWYAEGAELRPGASGIVQEFAAKSGEFVRAGETIAQLGDPEIEAEIVGLEARIQALEAQRRRELATDRDKAMLTAEEISYVTERLETAQARRNALVFRSPFDGRLIIPRQRDLEQGWIGRGVSIGHIAGSDRMVVLAALKQSDMELVARRLEDVAVRLASDLRQVYSAHLARLSPEATDRLPAELLSREGGGPFSLRQNAPQETGLRTIETIFILEIAFDADAKSHFGERAFIRFDHGTLPIAHQLARGLRQLFLREFEV